MLFDLELVWFLWSSELKTVEGFRPETGKFNRFLAPGMRSNVLQCFIAI